jgi:hypothetical protein
MWNLTERNALGATTYMAVESKEGDARFGLRLRYRRWLNSRLSLNASGGFLFLGSSKDERFPSFASHVDLNYWDLVAPYVGCEVLRYPGTTLNGASWHAGVKFGSYAAMGLTGLALAIAVLSGVAALQGPMG